MRIALEKNEIIEACKEYISRHYLKDNYFGMKKFDCNPDDIFINIDGLVFKEIENDNNDES